MRREGKEKAGGERERKTGWKMKRDKRRGLGWKRSRSLEAFCGCLTPLVLLMCDAQEIDRLCKNEPTGENNNNHRRTRLDGTVHRATQTPNPGRGSGTGPRNPPAIPGRLAEHVSPRRQPSCFSSSDLNLGGMKSSCCPQGQILHPHQRAWDPVPDLALLLFFMQQVRNERRTKTSKHRTSHHKSQD